MTPETKNREAWLTEMAKAVEPEFREFKLVPYRVTCGWPCKMALGASLRRVGECHAPQSSKGGLSEIFISPLLDDPIEVAGTVAHELAHVAAGAKAGHGPWFRKVAKAAGLTKGKPTSVGPGPRLEERLRKIAEGLGPYPHVALAPPMKPRTPAKPTVGVVCGLCGCTVRMEVEWVNRSGLPHCGCGGAMTVRAKGE